VGWDSFGMDWPLFVWGWFCRIFSLVDHPVFVAGGYWTLMESLILAQDERWRRA
jgi:hypothetical protein